MASNWGISDLRTYKTRDDIPQTELMNYVAGLRRGLCSETSWVRAAAASGRRALMRELRRLGYTRRELMDIGI